MSRIVQSVRNNFVCLKGDALSYVVGSKFSTKDQLNYDTRHGGRVFSYEGGWWHKAEHVSNLNGPKDASCTDHGTGSSKLASYNADCDRALVAVSMKLRPFAAY